MASKAGVIQHGSLFSGIGGFDLAAGWCGWENVFHCEISEFCNSVLKYYWPHAEAINDIRNYDWGKWKGKIDVLSGGFPCQPYSVAGKKLGKEDPRHLWPEMLRAIQQVQPQWVVGENVRGLISWNGGMVFHEVQSDLENEGYEVLPFLLPAAGVNAPHRRERIWFIASKKLKEFKQGKGQSSVNTNQRKKQEQQEYCTSSQKISPTPWKDFSCGDIEEVIAKGIQLLATNSSSLQTLAANTHICKRCKGWLYSFRPKETERKSCTCSTWDVWDAWRDFPTQSPICNGNDGISEGLDGITFPKWRKESIKAGGNAIVPQVAFQIFKAINEFIRG